MDKNILSILFGESSHVELIKRSGPLLRYLYGHKRISSEDINMIAQLAFSKHDAFRTWVFKILAEIADMMSIDELEVYLWLLYNVSNVIVSFL